MRNDGLCSGKPLAAHAFVEKSQPRNVVLTGVSNRFPPKKICFMMLFSRGFPSGSFEKIQFHDVVLTRISGKILER